MVEIINGETGEIKEVSIQEAAVEMIERPPYWRRVGHAYTGGATVDEGEWHKEFDEAFLSVQSEAGPLIWAESKNDYNDSRYATLGALLAKVHPILIKNKLTYNQGVGKVNIRSDVGGKAFLPIWTRVTHVPTGQWQRVWIEMPMIKFDPQAYGTLMTYGRRYALVSYLGLAATDDDGVWASAKPSLDSEMQERKIAALLKQIAKCETEIELRNWNKGIDLTDFGEEAVLTLKKAWQTRLGEITRNGEGRPIDKKKRGEQDGRPSATV